jgi:hypothetical protein
VTPEYDVSSNAITRAMLYGLGEDQGQLVKLLQHFAHNAAIVTHPEGNRRYGGYVLDMDELCIYSISKLRHGAVCPDCHGTKVHRQYDQHQWVDVPCQTCQGGHFG